MFDFFISRKAQDVTVTCHGRHFFTRSQTKFLQDQFDFELDLLTRSGSQDLTVNQQFEAVSETEFSVQRYEFAVDVSGFVEDSGNDPSRFRSPAVRGKLASSGETHVDR